MRFLFALILTSLVSDAAGQPMMPGDPSFLQSTSSLRKGLVGYWRLEEASGTRYDCSPYGNHLTANNSPGQAAGKVGNCATFVSGSNQGLSGATSWPTFPNHVFTFVLWVNSTNNARNVWLSKGNIATANNEFGIYAWTGTDVYFEIGDGSHNVYVGPVTTTHGVWHFFAGWYNGTHLNLQLDNGTVASNAVAYASASNNKPFAIGEDTTPYYANAGIDEVGFWNRVLTTAELTQLYNAGLGTHFPWAHP